MSNPSSNARIVEASERPVLTQIAGFDIQSLIFGNEAQSLEVFFTSGKDGTEPATSHSHPWDETFW
jgi:hypothetical protein